MTLPTWTLQDRIRKARDHAGLNQSALAEAIGVSTNSVNRWEKGERNPTQESLESIAHATNVPLKWFLSDDGNNDGSPQEGPPKRLVLELQGDSYKITQQSK